MGIERLFRDWKIKLKGQNYTRFKLNIILQKFLRLSSRPKRQFKSNNIPHVWCYRKKKIVASNKVGRKGKKRPQTTCCDIVLISLR